MDRNQRSRNQKKMRRRAARRFKIPQIPRSGVVAPSRIMQDEKLDLLRASLRVITRMRRRHASHPPRSAASAPAYRNRMR